MFKIMKNILSIIASIFLLGSITVKADVVVASAGPMSGQYASFGAQLKAGAEMWLKILMLKVVFWEKKLN